MGMGQNLTISHAEQTRYGHVYTIGSEAVLISLLPSGGGPDHVGKIESIARPHLPLINRGNSHLPRPRDCVTAFRRCILIRPRLSASQFARLTFSVRGDQNDSLP